MSTTNATDGLAGGQEMFDRLTAERHGGAMPDAVEAEADAPETDAPDGDGQPRDDAGRFAAKATGEATATQDAPQPAQTQTQPALAAPEAPQPAPVANDEVAALKAELAAMRNMLMAQARPPQAAPKPEAPPPLDPVTGIYEDPQRYVGDMLSPVQRELAETREYYSRQLAVMQHGQEKVSEAYGALKQAIASGAVDGATVQRELNASRDPFGDIIAWHNRTRILSEVGSDPAGYEKKVLEKALNDPEARARIAAALGVQLPASSPAPGPGVPNAGQPAPATGNVVRIPASLSRTTSAASAAPAGSAGMDGMALFDQLTAERHQRRG